jgi:hypothetical protein
MPTASQKNTKKHAAPLNENADLPPLKRGKTGNFDENAVPDLSVTDLPHLKAIYNAKARKNKYIRGSSANDVDWVYAKAIAIDPRGTREYISAPDFLR